MCLRAGTEGQERRGSHGWQDLLSKTARKLILTSLTEGPRLIACRAMITLTSRAAKQVRSMHAELNAPSKRLRVFVESGGCSGFQYGMSFDELKPDDAELESEGVALIIDPTSLAYLQGSSIDFD